MLRLYNIADYTAFQGDQGIDSLAAMRLLVDHVLPVEGPATSAGGVHLGPFYYYLLAVPMAIVWLDPFATAVFMAVLGALATALLYVVAQRWFGARAACVSAALFAVSPAIIATSRSAWNPSPLPTFVLIAILGLARSGAGAWLVAVGLALSCAMQLHYFSLALAVSVLAAMAYVVVRAGSWRLASWAALGIAAGMLIFAPFVAHEISTDYPNLRAVGLLAGQNSLASTDSVPRRLYAVLVPTLIGAFMTAGSEPLAIALAVLLLAAIVGGFFTRRYRTPCAFIGLSLVGLMVQTLIYRGPVFEHYLTAYAPLVFLALAAAVALVPSIPVVQAIGTACLVVLFGQNLTHLPFGPPERQLARSELVATQIASAAGTEPFGLWMLADDDSDGAYRFQLERMGHPPARAEQLVNQLFVVCQRFDCDEPTVRAALGGDWSTAPIAWRTSTAGVDIFRLTSPS